MRTVLIQEFLSSIDVDVSSICLGEYDEIGELTAKKTRRRDDPLYAKVGWSFRPNLERGILLSSLVRRFEVKSFLEVGWGRGYSSTCVAKTFDELGTSGTVTTIDTKFDEQHLALMKQAFPTSWLKHMTLMEGKSSDVLRQLREKDQRFDLVYIDGDHTYEGVKSDWELCKGMATRFNLFDDYHLPSKDSGPGIEVARLVDEIDWDAEGFKEPVLIIGDRRIFFDDRRIPDDQVNAGQVLVERKQQ